jgi:prephenate dehydrogenase
MRTLAIVGVGLIGGSIALAARARGVAQRIVGFGPNGHRLERPRPKGMIDEWHGQLPDAVRGADAVVVCTQVDLIANQVAQIAACARPGTLITDVGSTKAVIVKDVIGQVQPGTCFVGGHPLAGSEKSGPHYADAKLFEGRLVILTPDEHFDPTAVVRATTFWEALGARVKYMSPEEHDLAVAVTSHLPHLVAAALASMLPPNLRDLAASGFRDTTRIAAGDPALWQAIMDQNRGQLAQALAMFRGVIDRCFDGNRADLDMTNIHALLIEAKRSRDALGS